MNEVLCCDCVSVCFGGGVLIIWYSVQAGSFISPELHPDTLDFARRLIDELQSHEKNLVLQQESLKFHLVQQVLQHWTENHQLWNF